MNSFDKWKEEYGLQSEPNYSEHTEKDCKSSFEAGQQSQQAKIDELNADFRKVGMALATATKEAITWMDKSKKSDFINQGLELKIDELQSRVDEALKQLDLAYPESWYCCVEQTIDILKGNKDEN